MTKTFRFLLIDDSAFDLLVLKKMLSLNGLSSSANTYNSAEDAIEYLKQQTEMEETVMLLDLQMPGMDGFEFMEQFDLLPAAIKDPIQVYMLSSTIDSRDLDKAKANSYIKELLSKPINIEKLKTLLIPEGA